MDHLWLDQEMQEQPPIVIYQEPGNLAYIDEDTWEKERAAAIYVQESWFRLLARYHALLGIKFVRDEWISGEDEVRVLTSWPLHTLSKEMTRRRLSDFNYENVALRERLLEVLSPDVVHDWFEWADIRPVPFKLMTLNQVKKSEAEKQLLQRMNALFDESAASMRGQDNLLAFAVLSESLSWAFTLIHGHYGTSEVPREFLRPDVRFFEDRARRNGLCAQRLDPILWGSGAVVQSVIATSFRLHKHDCNRDHYCQHIAQGDPPEHWNCDGCETEVVNIQDLEAAIARSGRGLLHYDGKLEVVEQGPYVAFSHVWSHGLGNPHENGLPVCQLRRLAEYGTFWVDPICVPHGEYKARAIENMAMVYKDAKVVVLDRELLKCRGTPATKRIAVLLSDWVTRIWTLQEAVFGDLWFAFADGLMHVDTLLEPFFDPMVPTSSAYLSNLLSNRGMLGLAQNFHSRTTTVASDEGVCLAILLGKQISDVPGVIQQLGEVEQDLIYVQGERCARKGLRWCPQSLLSKPARIYGFHQQKARISEKGILMRKDIILMGDITVRELIIAGDIVLYGIIGITPEQTEVFRDTALIFERPYETAENAAILVSNASGDAHYEHLVFTRRRREGDQGNDVAWKLLQDHEMWVD